MGYKLPSAFKTNHEALTCVLSLAGYESTEIDAIINSQLSAPNAIATPMNGYNKNTSFYNIKDRKENLIVFGIEKKVSETTKLTWTFKKATTQHITYNVWLDSKGNLALHNHNNEMIADSIPQGHKYYKMLNLTLLKKNSENEK